MAFPSPSFTPPTLRVWQMSFGGLIFGGVDQASTYQLQQLVGIDGVDVGSGDVQRALDQGEIGGMDVLKGRDVTITQVVKSATDVGLDAARQALGGVMAYGGIVEQPLCLRLASGTFACMARPRRHNFTIDVSMVFAKGGVATTQLHATDPRWYASPSKSASVGLPGPLGGVRFPLTFPASFGGGTVGGTLQAINAGLFEMRPLLVFTGPVTNPAVQNLSLVGGPMLRFNMALAAGDTLVVDTDLQSIVYTPSGAAGGASRRTVLDPNSTWFNLIPGTNQLLFTSSDTTAVAGTLSVQSADAWMSL